MNDEKDIDELDEHKDGDFTVGQIVGGALRHDPADPEEDDAEDNPDQRD